MLFLSLSSFSFPQWFVRWSVFWCVGFDHGRSCAWRIRVFLAEAGIELACWVQDLVGAWVRSGKPCFFFGRLQKVAQVQMMRLGPSAWSKCKLPWGLGFGSSQQNHGGGVQWGCQAVPEFRWVAGLVLHFRPNWNKTGSVMQGSSVYFWMCDC